MAIGGGGQDGTNVHTLGRKGLEAQVKGDLSKQDYHCKYPKSCIIWQYKFSHSKCKNDIFSHQNLQGKSASFHAGMLEEVIL